MEAFFDSVWMNVAASVLVAVLMVLNIIAAGKVMSGVFDKEHGVWAKIWRTAVGVLLGLAGSVLAIFSLIAIWNDCPAELCF